MLIGLLSSGVFRGLLTKLPSDGVKGGCFFTIGAFGGSVGEDVL